MLLVNVPWDDVRGLVMKRLIIGRCWISHPFTNLDLTDGQVWMQSPAGRHKTFPEFRFISGTREDEFPGPGPVPDPAGPPGWGGAPCDGSRHRPTGLRADTTRHWGLTFQTWFMIISLETEQLKPVLVWDHTFKSQFKYIFAHLVFSY